MKSKRIPYEVQDAIDRATSHPIVKLKPCPICDSSEDAKSIPVIGYAYWQVICGQCNTRVVGRYQYHAEAIWNNRPEEDRLNAEIARLKQELDNKDTEIALLKKWQEKPGKAVSDG